MLCPTVGGNYGETSPTDLGMTVTALDGQTCAATPDAPAEVYANSLSVCEYVEHHCHLHSECLIGLFISFPCLLI